MKDNYKQNGIYRITDTTTGRSYIGQTTTNFGDRWDSHRSLLRAGKHGNALLQEAWDLNGESLFEFAVIHCAETGDVLDDLEREYIAEYRRLGLCFNILDGGKSYPNEGKHLSEDAKRKIGEKNRIHMTGRKHSDETKRRMSSAQRQRFANMSDEDRRQYGEMMSARVSGHKWNEESRAAFAERQRIHPNSASKFTAESVRSLREKADAGVNVRDLAAEYGTTVAYVKAIIERRRWART